jgi:asparagine synthase (glutamine-hydrolysing)
VNGAFELESRVPLLDEEVVEFAFSTPPKYKFSGGAPKHLLRSALAGLVPQDILDRRDKMGFPVPFAEWLKEPRFYEYVSSTLEDSALAQSFAPQTLEHFGRDTWGAFSLAIWERRFGVTL